MLNVFYLCIPNFSCHTCDTVNVIGIGHIPAGNNEFHQHILAVIIVHLPDKPHFGMEVGSYVCRIEHLKDILFKQRINLSDGRWNGDASFIAEDNHFITVLKDGFKQQMGCLYLFLIHVAQHAEGQVYRHQGIKPKRIGHSHSKIGMITLSRG